MNKTTEALLIAYEKGYRVIDGVVYYRNKPVAGSKHTSGYFRFQCRVSKNKSVGIPVHRLVAYQKFGKKMFRPKIEVRHLDSNEINNKEYNIGIGTPRQNCMDKSPEVRLAVAIKASNAVKKHDHDKILSWHQKGWSYGRIMKELGLKSKGTISYIVKQSMATKNKPS